MSVNMYNSNIDGNIANKAADFQLTPLHLAVIQDNKAKVRELAATNMSRAIDHKGWTPAHHAAIKTDRTMLDLLETLNAAPEVKSSWGTTPNELWEISHIPSLAPETEVGLIFDEAAKKSVPLTAGKFKEISGCTFVNRVHVPQELIVYDWADKSPLDKPYQLLKEELTAKKVYEEVDAFFTNPPKLTLSNVHPISKTEKVRNVGYGLYTKEPIKEGAIVAIYAGEELQDDTASDAEYLLEGVDGNGPNKLRGLACYIQDGFPNVACLQVPHCQGQKILSIFRAIADIGVGRMINFDYGSGHRIKYLKHTEFKTTEMVKFVKNNSMQSIRNLAMRSRGNGNMFSSFTATISHLLYILNTPSAFLTLFFQNHIKLHNLSEALKFPFIADSFFHKYQYMLHSIQLIEKHPSQEIKQTLYSFLLDKVKNDGGVVVLNILQLIPATYKFKGSDEIPDWYNRSLQIIKSAQPTLFPNDT